MSRFKFLLLVLSCVLFACSKEDQPVFFDPDLTIKPFPNDGSLGNSFRIKPYFVFNKEVEFRLNDPDLFEGYYKIKIDNLIFEDSRKNPVLFALRFSSTHDTLYIIPEKGLTANGMYTIKFSHSVLISEDNGTTFNPMLKDGVTYNEEFSSSFSVRTYSFPGKIDTSMIEYSYPVPYQYHFLRLETDRGVVELKEPNEALSYFTEEKFKARFSDLTGNTWENDAVYEPDNNKFIFKIPSVNFQNEKIYNFELISSTNGENNPIMQWHFRTSKFDRFEQKIGSIRNIQNNLSNIDDHTKTHILFYLINLGESFDFAEGKKYAGLIRFEAKSDPTIQFFERFNYFYSRFSTYIVYKDRHKYLKIPPLNAIYIQDRYLSPLLTSAQISDNSAPPSSLTQQYFVYCISGAYSTDFNYAENYINTLPINASIARPPLAIDLSRGYYYFKLYYYAGEQRTYESNDLVYIY